MSLTTEEIKAIRKKFNLTQVMFAKVLGLGQKTYTRYEAEISTPNPSVAKLLKVLDKHPEFIYSFIELSRDQLSSEEISFIEYSIENSEIFKKIKDDSMKMPVTLLEEQLSILKEENEAVKSDFINEQIKQFEKAILILRSNG